jgi:hypothetical protein
MPIVIPPVPVGEKENSYLWTQWYLKLQQLLSTSDGIAWTLLDKSGSALTDIVTRNHSDLQNVEGSGTHHLSAAQHTTLTGLPTIAAGTYTPTLTNVTNVAASTAYQCQYMRVGATITVSGRVDVDPTAAAATELGVSLPVASNFGASEDLAGVGALAATSTENTIILGDTTNDRASIQWVATDLANTAMYFTFTYQVI